MIYDTNNEQYLNVSLFVGLFDTWELEKITIYNKSDVSRNPQYKFVYRILYFSSKKNKTKGVKLHHFTY